MAAGQKTAPVPGVSGKGGSCGTGRIWHARDLFAALFARHGLDHAAHVRERLADTRRNGRYAAALSRLKQSIGRTPQTGILDVLDRMLALQRNRDA
jgi:hypothetical protein